MAGTHDSLPAFQYAATEPDEEGVRHLIWPGIADKPLGIFVRRFADKRLEVHYSPQNPTDRRRDTHDVRVLRHKQMMADLARGALSSTPGQLSDQQVENWLREMKGGEYLMDFPGPEFWAERTAPPSSWQKCKNDENKEIDPLPGQGGRNPYPRKFLWRQGQEIVDTCDAIAHQTPGREQYFNTLTCPGSTPEAVGAYNRHDSTLRQFLSDFVTKTLQEATGTEWAYCIKAEPQTRGATHYHMFLGETGRPLSLSEDMDNEEGLLEAHARGLPAEEVRSFVVNRVLKQANNDSAVDTVERSLKNSGSPEWEGTEPRKVVRHTHKQSLISAYLQARDAESLATLLQECYRKRLASIGRKEGVDMFASIHADQQGRTWDDIRHYACRVEVPRENPGGYMAKYMAKSFELAKAPCQEEDSQARLRRFQEAGLVQVDFPVRWWSRNRAARRLTQAATAVLTSRRCVGCEIAGLDEAIFQASSKTGVRHWLRLGLYNPGRQVQVFAGTAEQLDALAADIVPLVEALTKPSFCGPSEFFWSPPASLLGGTGTTPETLESVPALPTHRHQSATQEASERDAVFGLLPIEEQPPVSIRPARPARGSARALSQRWAEVLPPCPDVAGFAPGGLARTNPDAQCRHRRYRARTIAPSSPASFVRRDDDVSDWASELPLFALTKDS